MPNTPSIPCRAQIRRLKTGAKSIALRKRSILAVFYVLSILVLPFSIAHADDEVMYSFGEIKDPYLGEALFQYYQHDTFLALSQTLVALDAERLRHNKVQAKQLLAELMLSYGLHNDAERVLKELDKDNRTANVQDHAWLDLAASNFKRGLYPDAARALAHAGDKLNDEGVERKLALQGNIAMTQRDYAKAMDAFNDLAGSSEWGTYGAYNLGIALLNLGRFDKGIDQLDKVGKRNYKTEELKELRDRANLALGFLELRAKNPSGAKNYLERIRLDSSHATRALIGIGWSHMMSLDFQSALVPLTELTRRSSGEAATMEAHLAIPYSYTQLKATRQAVDAYEQAVSIFEDQIKQLDQATSKFSARPNLHAIMSSDERSWMKGIDGWPHSAPSRIFVRLYADPWFSATVRNYRDLQTIRDKQKNWATVVNVYSGMLAARGKSSVPVTTPNKTNEELTDEDPSQAQRARAKSRQMVDMNVSKISDIKTRTTTLKSNLDRAIKEHEAYLYKLVIAEIEREKKNVGGFLNQARFGLAQIYDQILRQDSNAP